MLSQHASARWRVRANDPDGPVLGGDTHQTRRRRWESAHIAYHSMGTATASFFRDGLDRIASLELINFKNWKDNQPPWFKTHKQHSSAVGTLSRSLPDSVPEKRGATIAIQCEGL